MDPAPNTMRCERCWAEVDPADFVVCTGCQATYHPTCRESSGCTRWGCSGVLTQPGSDFLERFAQVPPGEMEARARALAGERTELLEDYRGQNVGLSVATVGYAVLTLLVSAVIGLTNFGMVGAGVALVFIAGIFLALGYLYVEATGRRAFNRLAILDAELVALGFDRNGQPLATNKKAA